MILPILNRGKIGATLMFLIPNPILKHIIGEVYFYKENNDV